ncbi:MAG: MFS transporter [Betaproteobacteria bacterium]|nr:MFS transporter [Betaproteobacteria bacterium]
MSETSQFRLLNERRFLPFFLTQFFGAANDNVFKFAFTVLATYSAAEWGGMDPKSAGAVIGGIFIVPFVLFSATAGQLADKYDKASMIRFVKNLEIAIMLAIAAGFAGKIVVLLFAGVFMMGLHSTLFGPVKYAYLPQHLRETELVGGNGMVEMGTFVAILLGTILGGMLVALPGVGPDWVATVSVALAIVGRIAAGFVPASPAPEPGLAINWNPFTETWKNIGHARTNRSVFLSLLGISWLWFFGSIFLTTFTGFAKEALGGDQNVVTLLLAVFSIGIGVGSLLCERMSGHKVEIGLVPFGSIGMTVFALDLWLASRNMTPSGLSGLPAFLAEQAHWRVIADLFLLAMFSGFYSVPLYALIQSRCEPTHRARIIAANNILNALFMVVASVMAAELLHAGLSLPQLYLVVGLMNAAVALYIYTLVPEFLMRFIVWMLIHSVYRLEKSGLERIPDEGPAVIVCNHVSFVDPLVIAAACPRPIRFVMDHRIFALPVLSFVFRTSRAIPIAPAREDLAMMEGAFAEVAKALQAGDLVAIFPEGSITDTGELLPFRPGIKRILDATPVPVVPMALHGLWGSFFSRKEGAAMSKPWRLVPFRKIGLSAAAPVAAAAASPEALQAQVLALRGDWR